MQQVPTFPFSQLILSVVKTKSFQECVPLTNLLMTLGKVFSQVISKHCEGKYVVDGAGDAGKDGSKLLLKFNFF